MALLVVAQISRPVLDFLNFLLARFHAVTQFAHVTPESSEHMKARDVFGIIVRTIGLCLFLYALRYFGAALTMILGISHYSEGIRGALDYLFYAVPELAIDIALMLCARQIVRMCYPDNKDDSDS